MKSAICVLLFAALALGDLYMQNPRGSNDRLNEQSTDTDNQQRLFNSQNNAKGGYCWGPQMYFYEGSQLTIEWTNQHGCGSPKLVCQLIIQYMCGSSNDPPETNIRDGTTTNSISAATVDTRDASGKLEYGMHEPAAYYAKCQTRSGNLGLYMADKYTLGQVNKAHPATVTRSQNGGTQYGFECPEERDYYPYWVPNPWKDIAVLTDDISRCDYYKAESGNVKSRWECIPSGIEDTQELCAANGKTWTEVPAWGIPAPDCVLAPSSRDNHLGNGDNGVALNYNWTIPDNDACLADDTCQCVLRLRYNMTSMEIPFDADYTNNAAPFLTQNPTIAVNDVDAADEDGNVLGADTGNPTAMVKLAINTNQFSRTFQDRSHVFAIRPRPDGVASATRIYNLNVRGKRGNIVQTYPATEYDFVPNDLSVRVGDYIHFQWTGCDTNPAGNAGEGTDQTDRSNLVQVNGLGDVLPVTESQIQGGVRALFDDASTRFRMAMIDQTGCLTNAQLLARNNNNQGNADADVQNCYKLNAAATGYFDGGLHKMNKTGNFYYMSTRNNNFSNRGQKGTLNIDALLPTWAVVVVVLGAAATGAAGAAGAAMFYAKSHPHSFIAEKFASFEK